MRVFLIGYKSSGKSTTGRQLAGQLNMQFIDLDDKIEEENKNTIPNLFSSMEEPDFRELERKAFLNLKNCENAVIATGGGFPCWFDNIKLASESGIVIYLKTSDKTLFERLQKVTDSRPVLRGLKGESLKAYIKNLRNRNENFYEQAHIVFDSESNNLDELADQIEKLNANT